MSIYAIIGIVVLVLFLIIALSIATYSGSQFVETFEEINNIRCGSYTTTENFAQLLITQEFGNRIALSSTKEYLGDCFMWSQNKICISEQNADNTGVASLAVIAHEFGHAEQRKENPNLLKKMIKLRKTISLFGIFIMPLIIAGVVLIILGQPFVIFGAVLAGVGLLLFLIALWAKLKILPIEKDASRRGVNFLKKYEILDEKEMVFAKKVLSSAYLTYVGDFFRALLSWTFLTRKTKLY